MKRALLLFTLVISLALRIVAATTTPAAAPAATAPAATTSALTPIPTALPPYTMPATQRVAAVFVENRSGNPSLAGKEATFQSLLDGAVSGAGFSLVSRDVATTALRSLAAGAQPTPAEQALSNQTSALRLAQNLGANYVLLASLASYDTETRAFNGYGVTTTNIIATLRVAWRLCDAVTGGSLTGGTVTQEVTVPSTANLSVIPTDILNQLFAETANKVTEQLVRTAAPPSLAPNAPPAPVQFSIVCSVADIALPDILRAPNGQYVVGPLNYTLSPLDVTVELNGLAIGSAPGTFNGPPGISQMRLSRDGFKDWTNYVSLAPGFKLSVALQMSDSGYARWKDSLSFLQGLKEGAQLTDAEVQRILGIAQSLRQSGLLLNVQTTQLPPVYLNYQSLLGQPPVLLPNATAPGPQPSAPASVTP